MSLEYGDFFDKKLGQITNKFSFSTALKLTGIPPPSADWKLGFGKYKEVIMPAIRESITKAYQKGNTVQQQVNIARLLECFPHAARFQ